MAPRKLEQVALEPNRQKKNMKVIRFQFKRVKAEMANIRDDQQRIREQQSQIREKCGEIKRQCEKLNEETEMIMELKARTQIMIDLMFKILKAQKDGDFLEVAALTHLLREIVAKERAHASLAEVKDEEDP